MIGTGTPLLSNISADGATSPGASSLGTHQSNESKPVGDSITGQLSDVLDLSAGLRPDLRSSYKPAPGRGDSGVVDADVVEEQLLQVQEQLVSMRGLLKQISNPERKRILGESLQETGGALAKVGQQLSSEAGKELPELSKEFVSLVKGFREIVQEVERILADEDRIPAPLMRVIKDMTSKSLMQDRRQRVNELA